MKTTLFGGFAHHNSAIEGAKSSDLADQIFFFVSFLGKYPLTLFMILLFLFLHVFQAVVFFLLWYDKSFCSPSVIACISGCSFSLVGVV